MTHNFKYKSTIINNVNIFLLNINDNLCNIDKKIIPEKQTKAIHNYRLKYDQNKRLLARSFLYHYLSDIYKIKDFDLEYNKYCQPHLKINQNIDFSFSYSCEYVLIAVSDQYKIGIDIEYINKQLEHSEIKETIMHPKEIIYYKNIQTKIQKLKFFFRVFSIKESIIKSLGMGLYIDIKNINILDIRIKLQKIYDLCQVENFKDLINKNYKAYLCVKKNESTSYLDYF